MESVHPSMSWIVSEKGRIVPAVPLLDENQNNADAIIFKQFL